MTLRFLLLAFGLGWGALVPLFLAEGGHIAPRPWMFALLGVARFAPALAAVILTRGEMAESLLPRAGHGRAILAAVLAPLGVGVLATAWLVSTGTPAGPWEAIAGASFFPIVLQSLFLGPGIAEEPGWRGLALPRIQKRIGALSASVLLGLLAALWQWPLLRITTEPTALGPPQLALSAALPIAVILTWTYNRSGGSVFLCAILSASIAAAPQALERVVPLVWWGGGAQPALTGAWSIVAILLVVRTRGRLGS